MLNVEIKARCADPENIRQLIQQKDPVFKGIDHQTDTYFKVRDGRLKLRQGSIENNLIFYNRANQAGPKASHVDLFAVNEASETLKNILTKSLGVRWVVDKQREIYFIDNVKFHIDRVKNLGSFVEIEAIDSDGSRSEDMLREQCNFYIKYLGIKEDDLLTHSYSDLIAALSE